MKSNRNRMRGGAFVSRRAAAKLLTAAPLLFLSKAARAIPTPSAMEGPFYPSPSMRYQDTDNDLVKIAGRVEKAGGEVVQLRGRVLDRNGQPIAGARVEIWQCDVNGRYLHTGDNGGRRARRDTGFQGFGFDVTDRNGEYAFRTIKPVPYPGRTSHIHVKVHHGNSELTTQFYLAEHPLNRQDFLFRRMSQTEQDAVKMHFARSAAGQVASVDIRL